MSMTFYTRTEDKSIPQDLECGPNFSNMNYRSLVKFCMDTLDKWEEELPSPINSQLNEEERKGLKTRLQTCASTWESLQPVDGLSKDSVTAFDLKNAICSVFSFVLFEEAFGSYESLYELHESYKEHILRLNHMMCWVMHLPPTMEIYAA